jgi:hypothetical protein
MYSSCGGLQNDDKTSIGTNLKLNAPVHLPSKSSVGECIKVQAARSPGDNPGFEKCYRLERTRSGELAKCFGKTSPEGLRGRERDLLGECCEFLGLLG